MTDWMLFASEAAALAAVATINAAMGLTPGDGDVTTTWAVPVATADGQWAVPKPEDRFMAGVKGYTEGNPVWPADPGMGKS